jgi:Fe2+ or Zn2+ uptake regulation protein
LAYELAQGRHHHLVCRNCGREAPLPETTIAHAYRDLEAISGFAIDHEHVSLTGLCPTCKSATVKN